jgi:hypothetical protein
MKPKRLARPYLVGLFGLASVGFIIWLIFAGADKVGKYVSAAGTFISIFGVISQTFSLKSSAVPLKAETMYSELPSDVQKSQDEWTRVRKHLNANRVRLARESGARYTINPLSANTGLILPSLWQPPRPIDIDKVSIHLKRLAREPVVSGRESASTLVRPMASMNESFPRYTDAIREISPPRQFANNSSYRLLEVSDCTEMTFGPTTYFDALNVAEALAHEVARSDLHRSAKSHSSTPAKEVSASVIDAHLPFRALVGEPTEIHRRTVIPAISTLVIRKGDNSKGEAARFVLHLRDSKAVATAGDMYQVIPSGAFQPSSNRPESLRNDFSLWKNIMREYSEELLGNTEHSGDDPADYSRKPFSDLEQAKADGLIRVHLLGIGFDALTLWGEILTVAVFDPEFFDAMTPTLTRPGSDEVVLRNDREGLHVKIFNFDEPSVDSIIKSNSIASAGVGCLQLAWKHRSALLA